MTNNHILPRRRRTSRGVGQDSSNLGTKPCASDKSMPLRKGDTFHSPLSPMSPSDPTLSINNLPTRSLTSPKDLEALVIESDKRVQEIIKDFAQNLSLSSDAVSQLSQHEVLPVPSVFLTQATVNANLQGVVEATIQRRRQSKKYASASAASHNQTDHSHDSDSGLGTSISSGSLCEEPLSADEDTNLIKTPALAAKSVYSPMKTRLHGSSRSTTNHVLDEYATNQINKYIVTPLLKEEEFKEFHPLLEDVPRRIASNKITCLRDLEKSLIFLAEFKATSPASYLVFCNTAIQSIHTTVAHLNDSDLRRPTDRPYNNHYFIDLVEQVRQYARIMAVTRQKKASGLKLDEKDHTEDEELQLRVQEGKPAELVRQRADGTFLAIDAGLKLSTDDDDDDTVMDADVARSMARKRKCDIGKVEYRTCRECDAVFTRSCDLTKHEKTHSRPWKCPESDCRYHNDGWPTEKERDRHVNDKHSKDAALFKCLFEPCTYSSKRESNCKQHMEKAHNWEYVRAKSKKGDKAHKLVPTAIKNTASTKASDNALPTPASSAAFPTLSTPSSMLSHSPATLSDQSFSPASDFDNYDNGSLSLDHTMTGMESALDQSIYHSNQMLEQDPLFSDWVANNDNNAPLFSPAEVPDLLNTPGTGYTNSPANSNTSMSSHYQFTFGLSPSENQAWEQVRTHFPNWFDGDAAASNKSSEQQTAQGNWTMGNQNGFTYPGQQEYSNSYNTFSPTINTNAAGDFTLFGSDTNTAYNNNCYGAMFPDLTSGLGQQFHDAPVQEETIYDDVDDDEAMKGQDDLILEQFMNFDGDEQGEI